MLVAGALVIAAPCNVAAAVKNPKLNSAISQRCGRSCNVLFILSESLSFYVRGIQSENTRCPSPRIGALPNALAQPQPPEASNPLSPRAENLPEPPKT